MSSTAPVAALAALVLLLLAFLSVLTPCTAKIQWSEDEGQQHPTYGYYTIEVKRNPSLSFGHYPEEDRDQPMRTKKDDSCCGLGYRSQWLSWGRRRRIISYCPDSLPCCSHLVSKEIEMWGGFGFTLCIQPEQKKEVVKMNPFTRYLNYYERKEEE